MTMSLKTAELNHNQGGSVDTAEPWSMPITGSSQLLPLYNHTRVPNPSQLSEEHFDVNGENKVFVRN